MPSRFLRLAQKKLTRQQRKEVRKASHVYRCAFVGLCVAGYAAYSTLRAGDGGLGVDTADAGGRGRRLAGGSASCSGWLDGQNGGHATGYLIATLYMFLGLAIVCDEWFVPSLEKISEKLNLSADVAGATFLAAGSSAPEFFTSLGDTFSTANSIGVGTIVGSAMFNILVIVAMAAASTKETLNIDWKPVVRDCSFYAISIATLIIFFQDGKIYWWEGLIMTLLYGAYIMFMVFNGRIFKVCDNCTKGKVVPAEAEGEEEYKPGRRKSVHHHKGLFQGADRSVVLKDGTTGVASELEAGENPGEAQKDADAEPAQKEGTEQDGGDGGDDDDDDDDPDNYWSRFSFPADDGALDKFLWVVGLPLLVLFTFTVPDCSKTKAKHLYPLTFVLSIAWIGGLCYFMVQFATWIGCIAGIDPIVMGITLLAIGTSIPDALGSMIVARAGEADMAIANAVGSNVFDILLGLGFPWMLRGIINSSNSDPSDDTFPVDKCGILISVIILFSTLGCFFTVLVLYKWKMNNKLGITFLILYLAYIIWVLLNAYVLKVSSGDGCGVESSTSTTTNATRLLM